MIPYIVQIQGLLLGNFFHLYVKVQMKRYTSQFFSKHLHLLLVFFQFLLHYLKYLEDWFDPFTWQSVPLTRTCWALLRDSYHSPLALRYKPQHIAIAVIYMALQCHGVEVPFNRVADSPWWKVS